jgi:hypothetical protein
VKKSLCLVTVHGIGFQQPPVGGRPGYADALHEHLHEPLGELLGDDPQRLGDSGPVYVCSEVHGSRRDGLARLAPSQPLAPEGKIAHVALVYSPSEPLQPRLGSVADVIARAVLAHEHYISALGALRLAISDAWAAAHEAKAVTAESTLRPRTDAPLPAHHHRLAEMLHGHRTASPVEPGALGMFHALENDMATYVARNDLRERVRSFVEEALLQLSDRPDISGLVLNTHSQGTVIGWDVLCRLPFFHWRATEDPRASMLRAFVTAGSPIRKYVDLFTWGEQVGQLAALLEGELGGLAWQNFWDAHDPVADPLNPATAWKPGKPTNGRPHGDLGLLIATNPADGKQHHVEVLDTLVDNISNSSGGGLQAHDYWNNRPEFVAPLADILRDANGRSSGKASTAPRR